MPNRKKDYKDLDKWRSTTREQQRRYYAKTSFLYETRAWTTEEDKMVLEHNIRDRELSVRIRRSMKAIQARRARLKSSIIGVQDLKSSILEEQDLKSSVIEMY